jgi:hypothetical protein
MGMGVATVEMVKRKIGHHPQRNELLAHERSRCILHRFWRQFDGQRELDFSGKLRVLSLLDDLHMVP